MRTGSKNEETAGEFLSLLDFTSWEEDKEIREVK